jgi:hypothetical protein
MQKIMKQKLEESGSLTISLNRIVEAVGIFITDILVWHTVMVATTGKVPRKAGMRF